MRLRKKRNRRTEPRGKLELEKVIGLTTTNSSGFASNFSTGDFVYLAGCVVVVYNVDANCQVRFLVASRTPKALTCVAYSHYGGKFIAAGESGHQPAVIIWDSSSGSCIADLKAHKYGVSCVDFSPNGKHLVSVGFPHDGFLCLWDWRSETLVSKIRATTAVSPITSVHFSSDGNFFLTAGAKHLKYWTVGAHAGRRVTAGIGTLAIDCNPVNLGSQKESSFISVSSASCAGCFSISAGQSVEMLQPIYALTTAGILCLLHSGVAIKKWVDLKVQQGYGLAVSDSHVACACSNGVVRLFMQETLVYAGTLPKPAPHGYHGLTDEKVCASLSLAHNASGLNFPDAIACSFSASKKLAVIYGDHSLYVWDVHNLSKIIRCCAFLSHSACIWDISILPSSQTLGSINCSHSAGAFSAIGAFVTCSADGTIRLWDLALAPDTKESYSEAAELHSVPTNVFCKDVLGVIYSDRMEPLEKQVESEELADLAQGFRSLAVSADGAYLAAGDRSGNLCVYDLSTFDLLSFREAHDAEILTLNFSNGSEKTITGKGSKDHCLLASGGRDQLIHVYDVNREFDVIETLDDHSASITTVKFACNSSKLLSCSADKSVVFRNIITTDSGCKSTRYHQEVASYGTVYDMDIEPGNNVAVTVGQDKKIKILSLTTGKPERTFKQAGDVGEPIKVCVDQSGSYIICSHADKCMRIYDFISGDLVVQASGHAEVITGARFLSDCKHVISVSGDSCIFVWKLPAILSKTMRKRFGMNVDSCASANSSLVKPQPEDTSGQDGLFCQLSGDLPDQAKHCCQLSRDLPDQANDDPDTNLRVLDTPRDLELSAPSAYKFTISRLPKWAQTKVMNDKLTAARNYEQNTEAHSFRPAESRWAERLGADGYRLFTEDKTPPATIRPHVFGPRRCFTKDDQSNCLDSTPESSFGSHIHESSASSDGQQSFKKDTHWRTVHTVVFDEMEVLKEGHSECNGQCLSTANIENVEQIGDINVSVHPQVLRSIADPLISEMPKTISMDQYKTPQPIRNVPKVEDICNNFSKLGCNDNSYFQTSKVPESNFLYNLQSHYNKLFMTEASSDDDESDDEFCSNKDLFSTHFGSLSTAFKLKTGTTSARSSFSTRFFAHTSSIARTTLFQTSPREKGGSLTDSCETSCNQELWIDAASLLDTERERLKQLEQQGKVVHQVPVICDNSASLTPPTSEGSTNVENKANLNAGVHDSGVCGYNIQESVNLNDNCGNPFDNSLLSSLHPFTDVKDLLVTLDVEIKDKTQVILQQQDNEMPTRKESKIEHEAPVPPITISSECDEDLDLDCPSSSHSSLILQDQPILTDLSCAKIKESNLNHFSMELQQCSLQSHECSAVDMGDSVENDDRESDCSVLQLDLPVKSEKVPVTELPRSVEEYKAALKNLSDAAEKALSLFSELKLGNTADADSICRKSSSDLSDFVHGIIPTTLEKVQRLCDLVLPDQLYESRPNIFHSSMSAEDGEKPTLNNCSSDHQTVRSRECRLASVARSEVTLDSVSIEGFVQRYSERLSQSLSSQVLALVQKGLSSQNET